MFASVSSWYLINCVTKPVYPSLGRHNPPTHLCCLYPGQELRLLIVLLLSQRRLSGTHYLTLLDCVNPLTLSSDI